MATVSSDSKRTELALDVLSHMTIGELVSTMDYMTGIVAYHLHAAGYDMTDTAEMEAGADWDIICIRKRVRNLAKSVQDQIYACERSARAYAESART